MKKLKIALLVDAENFLEPLHLFGQFTDGLTAYGTITDKVAIGGWGFVKHLNNWREVCLQHKIKMQGYNGFNGKNAADRALIALATKLVCDKKCNALAIYSRDTGFSIGFASLKILGVKIIAPVINKEFIPDADFYIKTDKSKLSKGRY